MPPVFAPIYGSDLVNIVKSDLAGYANAFDGTTILTMINEGQSEVWTIIKELRADYFSVQSGSTDNTQSNFFPQFSTTVREYPLPPDYAEMRFIEDLVDVGFEDIEWVYRPMDHPDFKDNRRASTTAQSSSGYNASRYIYTIAGNQFVCAQFPTIPFSLTLWYIRFLPPLLDEAISIPDIILPYATKIATFAVKRLILSQQDPELFAMWKDEWSKEIITINNSAAIRQSADAVFVQDYTGMAW